MSNMVMGTPTIVANEGPADPGPAPAAPVADQGVAQQADAGAPAPASTSSTKAQDSKPLLYSDADVAALNAKAEKGYEPTTAELEAYRRYQKGEKKVAQAPQADAQDGEAPADPLADPQADKATAEPLQNALKLVGAKDLTELPEKIKGLQQAMTSTGGKLGEQVKQLQKQLEAETQGFKSLLADAMAGVPAAIEYAKKELGIDLSARAPAQQAEPADEYGDIPDDVADVGTYRLLMQEIKGLKGQLSQYEQATKSITDRSAQEQAHASWVETIGSLVAKNPDLSPKGADLGTLLREYWTGTDDAPVDPRIQPIIDVITFAHEQGIPNLEHARTVMTAGAWQKQREAELLEAEKRGMAKLTAHPPTVGLSGQRAQGTTDTHYSPVSEADLKAMTDGERPIPASWKNEQGQFVRSRVPKNAWGLVFGG